MANAGVVGAAELITPQSAPANTGLNGTPAMWAFIWVGFALLVLVVLHLAITGRASR
jgi:branched-subunit amino acid permease